MSQLYLSNFISIKRRYSRSINLERDFQVPESVLGYIPTSKSIDALARFTEAYSTPNSVRAWTITGVYGTGKSAFAHFISSLSNSKNSVIRNNALSIIESSEYIDKSNIDIIKKDFPKSGLIQAIITAQREPLTYTILKSLHRGLSAFPDKTTATDTLLKKIKILLTYDHDSIKAEDVLEIIKEISNNSGGILLIIDELGKNLEFIAQNNSKDDLYLLQQIAELPSTQDIKVFVFCILHQSISDYAYKLSNVQINEWKKIEGRFENLPFYEVPEQIFKLIGNAIEQDLPKKLGIEINTWAESWNLKLNQLNILKR